MELESHTLYEGPRARVLMAEEIGLDPQAYLDLEAGVQLSERERAGVVHYDVESKGPDGEWRTEAQMAGAIVGPLRELAAKAALDLAYSLDVETSAYQRAKIDGILLGGDR